MATKSFYSLSKRAERSKNAFFKKHDFSSFLEMEKNLDDQPPIFFPFYCIFSYASFGIYRQYTVKIR